MTDYGTGFLLQGGVPCGRLRNAAGETDGICHQRAGQCFYMDDSGNVVCAQCHDFFLRAAHQGRNIIAAWHHSSRQAGHLSRTTGVNLFQNPPHKAINYGPALNLAEFLVKIHLCQQIIGAFFGGEVFVKIAFHNKSPFVNLAYWIAQVYS